MKIISLLYFWMLWSTSCLAHAGIASDLGNTMIFLLFMLVAGIIFYFSINLLLLFLSVRFLLKNKTISIKTLSDASSLNTFISLCIVITSLLFLKIKGSIALPYILITAIVSYSIINALMYAKFLQNISKKNLILLVFFMLLLNPVHWWVVFTLFGWRVF